MTHKVHKGILHPVANVHSTYYTGSYKRCTFYSDVKKVCCNPQSAKHRSSCSRRCDLWKDKQGNTASLKEKTSSPKPKYDFTLKKVFTYPDGETRVKIRHYQCTVAAANTILKKAASKYREDAGWENLLTGSGNKQYDHAHLDALTWLGSAVSAGYQKAKDDYKRVRDELQLEDIIPAAETL